MTHELIGKVLVAYLRISDGENQDVARQRATIEEWATKHGLKISFWFEDSDGRNPRHHADKRPEFQRLIKMVESGAFDCIVVDSRDRFGTSNNYEFGKYIDILRKNGCMLFSVENGVLSSDDEVTILQNAVGSIQSKAEQRNTGRRNLGGKILMARAGEYPGGYPPHGLDVVCFDENGNQKWRLVWTAHFTRIKILNDGTEQEYVGKNNSPAHDKKDILRYRHSIKAERMDTIRQIFAWYAEESISPSQIATRLNEAKVDPVFGEAWNKQKIKQIIRNPVYIGYPTFNKRGSSEFMEYVDGEYRPPVPTKGKIVKGRKRKASDMIRSEKREFEPIVDEALFERCNQRMDEESEGYRQKVPMPRSPKTASFWLRNIIFCAGCNRPMRAWNAMPASANPFRSYFCANYGTYGRSNPTGCHTNRVKAELIEKIVQIYLDETHHQIAELLKLDKEDSDLLLPAEAEAEKKREEFKRINRTIMEFIGSCGTDGESPYDVLNRVGSELTEYFPDDCSASMVSDNAVYEHLFAKMKPELKRAVAKLDREHSKQIERLARVPKSAKLAIKKEEERLLQIEDQLTQARERLENLSFRSASIMSELQERYRCIENARDSIHDDSAFRRKAALVSQVIEKVDCRFVATGGTGKQPRTRLESVEIVPRVGDRRRFYPNGIGPGTD